MHHGHVWAKPVTRVRLREARASRSASATGDVATAIAAHLESFMAGHGGRGRPFTSVATYVSLPGEPGTTPLREHLRAGGLRVLLPVLRDDMDLDWVLDDLGIEGTDPLRPPGQRLGAEAVVACDLILVPALAVDEAGTRLGQGGGSYDRALARLGVDRAITGAALVLAVVHSDELLPGASLPREPHDIAVDGALTPDGVRLVDG